MNKDTLDFVCSASHRKYRILSFRGMFSKQRKYRILSSFAHFIRLPLKNVCKHICLQNAYPLKNRLCLRPLNLQACGFTEKERIMIRNVCTSNYAVESAERETLSSSVCTCGVKVTIHLPDEVSETVRQQKINHLYDILKPKQEKEKLNAA